MIYALDFGSRILIQTAYFVVISRSLGVATYGIFASITAITSFFACFSGIGADQVLIRRIAMDRNDFSSSIGNAIAIIILTTPPLIVAAASVCYLIKDNSIETSQIIIICVSDLVFMRFVSLANAAFQAHERAREQLLINFSALVIRLLALILGCLFSGRLTLEVWIYWYFGGAVLSMAIATCVTFHLLGRPSYKAKFNGLGDGLIYAFEFASLAGLRDLDKPLVVYLLGASAGGVYTAAFRIVDTASVPIRALLAATYTRYFHHSRDGKAEAFNFALRILPAMVGISCFLALSIFIGSFMIPVLLGEGYTDAISLVRSLAIYPLLLGLSAMGGDLLRAVGDQRGRVTAMAISTVFYLPVIACSAWLMGVDGAAYGRLITQFTLFILTAGLLVINYRRHRTSSGKMPDAPK